LLRRFCPLAADNLSFMKKSIEKVRLLGYTNHQAAAIQLLERAGYGFAETAGQ
jgi:hypothetical protein